jgi:hypothetical protein
MPADRMLSRRPLRRGLGRHRLASLERHAAFAARLANVRRGSRAVAPLVLALRRLRRSTPRVFTRVQQAMQWHRHATTVQAAQAAAAAPAPRVLLLSRLASRTSTHHLCAIVLQRLLERARPMGRATTRVERTLRVERQVFYPRLALPLPRTAPSVQPGERVRSATAVDSAAPVASAPRLPSLSSAKPQAIALAPQELSRVTDHVIRALDQRVLSYRERTGRI